MENLREAKTTLTHTDLLIIEMSMRELNAGQALVETLLPWLRERGFVPSIIEPCDQDYHFFEVLQVAIWYTRSKL